MDNGHLAVWMLGLQIATGILDCEFKHHVYKSSDSWICLSQSLYIPWKRNDTIIRREYL